MPGSSEHQTGLSMDVSTKAVSFLLRERFAQTLKENGLHRMHTSMDI